MEIRKQIETLISLQVTSSAISRLSERLQDVETRIETLDARLGTHVNELKLLESETEALQKTYRQLEADTQMNNSRLAKSQEKLSSVKTNKEYQSLLKEIEEIKKLNSKIEDEMLQCLEQIDTTKQTIAKNQEAYQEIEAQIRAERKTIEQEATHDREEMLHLQTEWNTISGEADPQIIKHYENVAQQGNGVAVVPVKNSVCQGCYMNIPPQMYNELHRFDQLMFCPHCQRIIYLQEDE
jgi:predicted  nucleic acid-binding Zn-ribbon protein